jgi:predicted type IV restriction endonuclease
VTVFLSFSKRAREKEGDVMKKLVEFIKKIQSDVRFSAFDEAAIKQGVALKILSLLEWDPFDVDEVQPEYEIQGAKVDFCLKKEKTNKVFIFVRKNEKDFPKHQDKVLSVSVQGKVPIGILTNGLTWWFFLPLVQGSADEKKFLTIEMESQKAEEASEIFENFLTKENVLSGQAEKAAEDIYTARQRNFFIKETLPKAWAQIMSDPKKWLADILGSVTEELCGYHPDREAIDEFISSKFKEKVDLESLIQPTPAARSQPAKTAVRADDYTGKTILSFTLKGTRYEVKSWKTMFLKFCEVVFPKNKDDLDVLFTLSKPGKEYFSKNPYQLLTCEKIAGTGMYVDVNLTAREVVDLSQRILHLLGYEENSLALELE